MYNLELYIAYFVVIALSFVIAYISIYIQILETFLFIFHMAEVDNLVK